MVLHTYMTFYMLINNKKCVLCLSGECGPEMDDFLERCGGMPEDQVFWTDNPWQQGPPDQIRYFLI